MWGVSKYFQGVAIEFDKIRIPRESIGNYSVQTSTLWCRGLTVRV